MSEAEVNQLPPPVDIDEDHPPSKKLKLSPDTEKVSFHASPNSPSTKTTPDSPNDADDTFDPVQALLEASQKCREEEEERQRTTSTSTDPKTNNDVSSEKDETGKDSDVASVTESDDGSNSDDAATSTSKKSERTSGKRNGVGKSKSKKKKKKNSTMRRNIKDILKHDQLDDLTIAARKEEEERRQRMNLKLQQQQQQLKFLQQQQQQLIRESEQYNTDMPLENESYHSGYPSRAVDDLLMKRLMRRKHITVSLDESGVPVQKNQDKNDVDCIQLSSDEDEPEIPQHHNSYPQHHPGMPEPPYNYNNLMYPSHSGLESELRRMMQEKKKRTSEVIALSSGEEDNGRERDNDGLSAKDARLYDGASSTIGGRSGEGDLDSDDDCVIISPGPDGEDEVEDKDECSQDLLNVPDQLGRVLVNVGHPEEDKDLFLPPQIAKIVKPHQIGGVRFLYDNVVESKDRYNKSTGFGCILAHAMGLGKTLQTVSFCDVLLRTTGKTVLIIVPINTIQNWLNEFNRYLPAKETSRSGTGQSSKRKGVSGKAGKKCDPAADETNQNQESPTISLDQGNSKGSEDTLLNSSFDSALTLSTDLTPCSENPEMSPELAASQPESSGVGSSSSQNSASSAEESEIRYRTFEVYLLNETVKSLQAREKAITTWSSKGGVLLLGYEMYRMLALKKLKRSTRRAITVDHEERLAEAESLDKIYECLVDPGPDCVICDEGHRIKNSGAGISQALKAIKTKRRVVLTGYPLQNNLMEYWCMVDFVRPNYLGTKAEFSNMFERPIQNGQCADSTFEDKRLMKYRSHVLHSLLEGFVQRRSHVVLKNALPQKEEWVFLVRLTPVQLKIYTAFINYLRDDLESDNASTNPIKAFAVCCKIWNHPDVLWNVVKKNLDLEMDLDIDEVNQVNRPKSKPRRGTGRPRGRPPLNGISLCTPNYGFDQFEEETPPLAQPPATGRSETSGISLEWAKPLFENYSPEVMENGVKFELLFFLIKETVAVGDKLLVFSQSLLTLDLIEIFLKKRLDWKKSVDYVRLDGSTAGLEREKLINEFNKSKVQKLFIISTRAGSLGINLVGANRVCIFDASWNPCHDSQAVCRVYRYGQTKPCHIYRFVADCTLEKRIYDRQVNKKGMADRIVDEMNPNTPFKSKDVSSFLVLQHELLDKLPYIKCDLNIEKFTDSVLRNVLQTLGEKITQEPFEHESLLIDQKHQKLSKSEKRLALKNYEKEKKTVANAYATYSRPNYSQYYSAIGGSAPMNPSAASYSSSYPMSSTGLYNNQSSMSSHSTAETNGGMYSRSYNGSMDSASFDKFERHIIALKSRGISVFPVEIRKDTFLQDPSGVQDMCIRAGERVYILVSQKGTYLRIQGKLLKVPFVGSDISQEQAEAFVMSLLQPPGTSSSSRSSSGYPVEQKLPPSNSMLYQKNPNHLQITDSINNTGGDVVMGRGANWNASEDQQKEASYNKIQHKTKSRGAEGLVTHVTTSSYSATGSSSSYYSRHASSLSMGSSSHHRHHSHQPDLQSLSRLETFCHRSALPFPQSQSDSSQRWSSSSSPSTSKAAEHLNVGPSGDLEVIKLNHSQSSNSSNSSSSRTNSPYSKLNLNNSNDGSISGGSTSAACRNAKDPSFYTDFTITPLSSGINATNSRSSGQQQALDNLLDNNDSRPPMSDEILRQKQLLSMTMAASNDRYGQAERSALLQQCGLDSSKIGRDSQLTDGATMRSTPSAEMNFSLGNNDTTTESDGGNLSLRSLLQAKEKFNDILGTNSKLFAGLDFSPNPGS